jgi:ribose transport system substrate-binding protein
MVKRMLALAGALALCALPVAACGDDDDDGGGGGGGGRSEEEIVIGWTPPDITGVFKTATDFFERAADDANKNGFDVKVISRSPATHTAFADQLAIIENFI